MSTTAAAGGPERRPERRDTTSFTEPFDLDHFFGIQRTPSDLPDPGPLIANLAQCVFEILAGAREVEQIGRWVTDAVYASLLRRALIASRARAAKGLRAQRPATKLLSTHRCEPAPGVIEATVIVRLPERVRAVAIRLEGLDHRWRATAIAVL